MATKRPKEKEFGLAVPNYNDCCIPGPYLGDMVWNRLKKINTNFEYIPVDVIQFADTSGKVVTRKSVRGKDIYIVHPYYMPHDSHVAITERMADEFYRSSANKVILFEPYNRAYRQDKRQTRESLDARIVADRYTNAGITRVFTFDPHFIQIEDVFSRECPIEVVRVSEYVDKHIKGTLFKHFPKHEFISYAPDIGSHGRAKIFADYAGIPMGIINKKRIAKDKTTARLLVEVDPTGKVEFQIRKRAIMRDDVYGTGGTLAESCEELKKFGILDVYACLTHLDLCKGNPKRYEIARSIPKNSGLHVIGTNSIPHDFTKEEKKYFDIIDISPLITSVIDLHSRRESISKFFEENYKNGIEK